jgi:hypothetical protein
MGQEAGVSEDGWVCSRCWEVSELGVGVEVSARSVSVGVSRDTKAVGVEDSAMESGMGCGLGRVKGSTPGNELASFPCRKKFHSQHGDGTFRTTEACRCSGSVGHGRQCRRSWIVQ